MIATRMPATLDPAERSQLRALADEVEILDGGEPLNEAGLLRLSRSGGRTRHVVLAEDARLLGYAQLDVAEAGEPAAELVVGPEQRHEVALGLLRAAEDSVDAPLLVWSRGRSPVGPAAKSRGYIEQRVMLVMSRPLTGLPPTPPPPPGIGIRPFRVGEDEPAWLAVNARAFADHPEQGAWTRADLDERLAQDWFDPAGFLLAVSDDGRLLGFHWTKLHAPSALRPELIAEVYVLGIDPSGQGRGLGKVLLAAGLQHLAGSGAPRVMLYLEKANAAALRLYTDAGFVLERRDVRLRGPATENSARQSP